MQHCWRQGRHKNKRIQYRSRERKASDCEAGICFSAAITSKRPTKADRERESAGLRVQYKNEELWHDFSS